MSPTPETPEARGESEGMSASGAACPICGKPREEWREKEGRGVADGGLLYCSEVCAREGRKSTGEAARHGSNEGQGFNDARGEFPDHYEVPKNNGLNVNNDPAKVREKEIRQAVQGQ